MNYERLIKRLRNGIAAGLCGGAIFGLIIQFIIGAMPAIGALYGAPGVIARSFITGMSCSMPFRLIPPAENDAKISCCKII
jgi:uncharacterized membrane protein